MHRIATVQTRGRVTLPARIRQALRIAPGDNVVFVETAAGRFEVKAGAQTAALLNRRPTARSDVPVRRRAPQMQLALPVSEHTSALKNRRCASAEAASPDSRHEIDSLMA